MRRQPLSPVRSILLRESRQTQDYREYTTQVERT